MIDQTNNLENLSQNFDEMGKNQLYTKEQITDFSKIEMFKINFKLCHIAISKNGGLIAICKKKDFFDIQKGGVLNKNLIVMFQDGIKRYFIPIIDLERNKKWIVCLDFTPKEDLYGILNDGGILKFKYTERTKKQKVTPQVLKEEGVINAKFFGKGFIAVTNTPSFYYIKDIKNPVAILMCSMSGMIDFSPNVDFLAIPSENSASNKMELLITNEEERGGIIQMRLKEEGQNIQVNLVNENYLEVVGASIIIREKPQKLYIESKKKIENEKDKKDKKNKKDKNKKEEISLPPPPQDEDIGVQNEIGKINAIAISPSGEKIAFYNAKKKIAFLFDSNFSGKYKEIKFNYENKDDNFSEFEIQEISDAIEYKDGCQFLFCGEDTLALSRQRFIILSKYNIENPLVYLIYENGETEVKYGNLFSKCIQEVDGIRFLTNQGVFLIRKVPKELTQICFPFSDFPSKKLIKIYKNTLERKYNTDKDIRSLSQVLAESIENLQIASANIFWTENNNEDNRKEIQLFILKAAQYAKKFVNKEDFNFDKFNHICKEMRIVNNLRNDEKYPLYITFQEYQESNPKEIIKKLIKYKNFKLAAEMSKFLEYGIKKVLYKYIICMMKKEINIIENSILTVPSKSKLKEKEEEEDENSKNMKEKYQLLFYNLEKVQGISYIKLAKKASKYGGEKLSMYLLELEKSDLIKIPQLLQNQDETKGYYEPFKIAFETYDFNAVIKVFKKIETNKKFFDILNNSNMIKYFPKILLYLKKYNKDKYNEIFNEKEENEEKDKKDKKNKNENMIIKGNFSELYKDKVNIEKLYLKLKQLYKIQTMEKRLYILEKCKNLNKQIENETNYDGKFMKKYIKNMKYSVEFKKLCQEPDKALIHYSELEPYSKSIYDCFKSGIMKEKEGWIDSQNKNLEYSHKKLSLLKFRSYIEMGKPHLIDEALAKTSLKKMGLTPMNLGEIYYDYKLYDKAAEYLIQVKEPFYFSYVVDLLKNMEKYKEALEVIISSKDDEGRAIMVNEILNKQPRLKKYVDELCTKYKVILQ